MARRKKQYIEHLDYHEGLSTNQVKIILREFGFGERINEFNKWSDGQTCPILIRHDERNRPITKAGVYEYDLFRWISSQKTGIEPLWD